MGKVNRREFFEELIATQTENELSVPSSEDAIFRKYANKTLPNFQNKTTGTLNQYSGQWTRAEAIHLLRRTTFGLKEGDITTLLGMTMSQAVDHLLNNIPSSTSPPVNNYNTSSYVDPTGVATGQTWVNAPYGDGTVNSKRLASFKSWWMGLMINQNLSINEKMLLFWHNHFATETTAIGDARFVYKHHALLRANVLGNFKNLVKQVTIDPGMLRYLNGYLNTKTAPDENYARELQELFTIGKGFTPIYDEPDIQAAAEVLTGWRYNTVTISSFFDATKHVTTNKQFTAFYNNTVITGQSGTAGAAELDDLVNMIFAKTETALHICRKLYRFFVYYNIDQSVESDIIVPMANLLISNNFETKPVISALLKSDHFFEVNSVACYIRTPMDFLVGAFRTFRISLPGNFAIEKQYAVWNYVRSYGNILNQDIGDPPDVSGWPAYYQVPEFYEAWINSTTLPKRMSFVDMMLNSGFSAGTGTAIKIDPTIIAKQCSNPGDPNQLIDYLVEMLLGLDLSANKKSNLIGSTLLSGQTSQNYWTVAWGDYIANPNTTNTNIVKTRLVSLLLELTHLAEHHLC